jgi:hypothetical protein
MKIDDLRKQVQAATEEFDTAIAFHEAWKQAETAQSRRARGRDEWEPDWREGRFSALMKCNSCGDVIGVAASPASRRPRSMMTKRVAPPDSVLRHLLRAFSTGRRLYSRCSSNVRDS